MVDKAIRVASNTIQYLNTIAAAPPHSPFKLVASSLLQLSVSQQ